MAIPNERTSLLPTSLSSSGNGHVTNARERASREEDHQDDVLGTAEPVDILASRFVAQSGSFGLSGGVGVLGTSLSQRGAGPFSIDTSETPTSRAGTIKRQRSHTEIQPSRNQPGSRRGSVTSVVQNKNSSRASGNDGMPTATDRKVDEGKSTEKQEDFLNGITKAQARACFVGVLLTWFVSSKIFECYIELIQSQGRIF
jgi:hypothetical protein